MDGGAKVVQFVPRADVDSRGNLTEFIRLAREDLAAFGEGDAWEKDRWEHGKTVAVFATKTKRVSPYAFTPLAEPFKQFAKAYVRYVYSHRPVVSVAFWVQAMRCIEAALLQVHRQADVTLLNIAVMDVSATKCREFYQSADVWHKTGLAMVRVFDFCRAHALVRSLPLWRSPFTKPKILTEDVGEAGKAHRSSKLPSNESMLALADLFCKADDKESKFYSSIMVLLMVDPGRVSEVLRLPLDCIGYEEDGRGGRQMYLRWWAAKGKGFTKKWVIPAMQDVVVEAVRRLKEVGAPARTAARFTFDQPRAFFGHGLAESAEGEAEISPDGFCAARERLVRHVPEEYRGRDWPFIDPEHAVHVWDALCLHRDKEFHRSSGVSPLSWRLPTATEVNSRLQNVKGLSLFERFGFKNRDGSSIHLTSHQLRHWLSTMSERAGMDDYTLAQWAGRARVADNRSYDHRTPEERLASVRSVLTLDKPSLLERVKLRQPVSYEELGVDRLGVAKPTLFGLCVHDYSMTPCVKSRQCMTCKEHVTVKGDLASLGRIRLLEDQMHLALSRAQENHEARTFGADRWVDHFKWELAHVEAIRKMLERNDVPEGTLLRIPEGHDPSPIQRAMMDLDILSGPSGSAPSALPVPILPPKRPRDA